MARHQAATGSEPDGVRDRAFNAARGAGFTAEDSERYASATVAYHQSLSALDRGYVGGILRRLRADYDRDRDRPLPGERATGPVVVRFA